MQRLLAVAILVLVSLAALGASVEAAPKGCRVGGRYACPTPTVTATATPTATATATPTATPTQTPVPTNFDPHDAEQCYPRNQALDYQFECQHWGTQTVQIKYSATYTAAEVASIELVAAQYSQAANLEVVVVGITDDANCVLENEAFERGFMHICKVVVDHYGWRGTSRLTPDGPFTEHVQGGRIFAPPGTSELQYWVGHEGGHGLGINHGNSNGYMDTNDKTQPGAEALRNLADLYGHLG